MTAPAPRSADPFADLRSAREALARGEHEKARLDFERSLARRKTPEALEGLAAAAWLLGDAEAALPALQSAYTLYRRAGDRLGAARIATRLALEHEAHRGEGAVASGWLARARRLLEGLEPAPEHAWLAVWEGHLALLFHNDAETARLRIAEARGLSASLGMPDVEWLALALEGVALVNACETAEGMRRLDEASAAAVGGEMERADAAGNLSCYLLSACERVSDFDRAAQWFTKVRGYIEKVRMVPGMTFCRDHLIGILLWRGEWKEAEEEIQALIRESKTLASRFVTIGELRLASLRHRQGRSDEAAKLFERLESVPWSWTSRAAMLLDQGDAEGAAFLVEKFFRGLPAEDRLDRAAGLEILARAHAAGRRFAEADAAIDELRDLVESVGTEGMRAGLRSAEGAIALSAGDHQTALRRLEDAVTLYAKAGGAFEEIRARLDLARALRALGRENEAEKTARVARDAARRIGAGEEVRRAESFLAEDRARPARAASPVPGLTPRETEILRLVSRGMSNPAIARKLHLSEHTVKRHVANILGKLDLPSRAAASAHAAKLGVV